MQDAELQALVDETRATRDQATLDTAQAAKPIIDNMLGEGFSVIDPEVRIWTSATAEDLRARIEDNPDTSKNDQWDKLCSQLDGAPRATVLMAAEIVLLRRQPVLKADISTTTWQIKKTLSTLDSPTSLPDAINEVLKCSGKAGFRHGINYNQNV